MICKEILPADSGPHESVTSAGNSHGLTATIDYAFPYSYPADHAAWMLLTRGREYPVEIFTDDPTTADKTWACQGKDKT